MFEQIKKDCPDAWERFEKYIFEKVGWEFKHGRFRNDSQFFDDIYFLIGLLFTFFDEQRIHIVIEYVCRLLSGGACYRYEVNSSRTSDRRVTLDWFKSRPEAWKSAIPKAFEILQKQLEEK